MPTVVHPESLAPIRFGDYELDPRRGTLTRNGIALKLQPQPLQVLLFLVTNAPHLVTREQICNRIWGDSVHVDLEQSLNFCIRQIRQVLDERSSHPRFIETLPRQGYRFIGTILPPPSPSEPGLLAEISELRVR